MEFKKGDIVSRKSYDNDIIFKIVNIIDETVYLKGIDFRLYADANIEDLQKETMKDYVEEDRKIIKENSHLINLDRDEYFYLPGKILHLDGDSEYLKRCMNFYKNMDIKASGVCLSEAKFSDYLESKLIKYNPDILVITGHDALYKSKKVDSDTGKYQNTHNFIKAVKTARKYEKDHNKLIIISGACQSDYEELIKAGSNFASSPKRINIHALDPAIIASSVALSAKNKSIDLISIISKTKYGSDGIGGIITNGTMYVGYPR